MQEGFKVESYTLAEWNTKGCDAFPVILGTPAVRMMLSGEWIIPKLSDQEVETLLKTKNVFVLKRLNDELAWVVYKSTFLQAAPSTW